MNNLEKALELTLEQEFRLRAIAFECQRLSVVDLRAWVAQISKCACDLATGLKGLSKECEIPVSFDDAIELIDGVIEQTGGLNAQECLELIQSAEELVMRQSNLIDALECVLEEALGNEQESRSPN